MTETVGAVHRHDIDVSVEELEPRLTRRAGWAGLRDTVGAILGAALGLLPHLLHHLSLFAGALVISGAAGNLVLGAVGLLMSVPLLRRLYRRFKTWTAPALAVVAFGVVFSLSAFVVGPALSSEDSPASDSPSSDTPQPGERDPKQPGEPDPRPDHAEHHGQ